jgi:hypothetical protein
VRLAAPCRAPLLARQTRRKERAVQSNGTLAKAELA